MECIIHTYFICVIVFCMFTLAWLKKNTISISNCIKKIHTKLHEILTKPLFYIAVGLWVSLSITLVGIILHVYSRLHFSSAGLSLISIGTHSFMHTFAVCMICFRRVLVEAYVCCSSSGEFADFLLPKMPMCSKNAH